MKTKNKSIRPNIRKVESVLAKVRKKYDIQNKFFNESDFYRICESESIELLNGEDVKVLHSVKSLYGILFTFSTGERLIYLRSFFNQNHRLCIHTAMHELGHYFLGHKGFTAKMFADGIFSDVKDEKEANLFARLATGKRGTRKT